MTALNIGGCLQRPLQAAGSSQGLSGAAQRGFASSKRFALRSWPGTLYDQAQHSRLVARAVAEAEAEADAETAVTNTFAASEASSSSAFSAFQLDLRVTVSATL